MRRTITFQGSPLSLVGRFLKIGEIAPDFLVASQEMKDIRLSDYKGKVRLISSFPSLDTPVCDLQVKEFNKRAAGISTDVVIIGISRDLPFAQKRFCSENGIKNEVVLSDYKNSSFGFNYGLHIKELNLLARSVHIVDRDGILRYSQLAGELTSALDFTAALKALEDVVKAPSTGIKQARESKCRPCEIGTPPLPKERVAGLLADYGGWQLVDDKKIVKEFKFKDFYGAKCFLDAVSAIAEEEAHHPTLTIMYNKLKVTLTTHASGGLTDNDFIMAGIIDEMES